MYKWQFSINFDRRDRVSRSYKNVLRVIKCYMDPEFNKMFSFKYKEAAFVMNLPIVEQQQVLADSKLIEIYLTGFSTQAFASVRKLQKLSTNLQHPNNHLHQFSTPQQQPFFDGLQSTLIDHALLFWRFSCSPTFLTQHEAFIYETVVSFVGISRKL